MLGCLDVEACFSHLLITFVLNILYAYWELIQISEYSLSAIFAKGNNF